ncbi:sulfite exporter TauE/SafE family protein [Gracilibacillus sp. S3-1-1]|uniref:Sulfite exporter TauE/SafE family protein n=1 Tax=Gracilibacillus pellucidus TaxID=3095368 RepID=A0ACC6M4A5_9BACI|nr:sulfite exporter TauE/SafE family protein [Gracilibacillus sp. S3-1-1]MDX8045647.1 sulfite exporter TauE/SafE family protein [Gracilibacillus sp. S3-1-1]
MLYFIYFLLGFIATLIGAIAGLGGGIIIKPLLDLLGDYNLQSISVLSVFTVFMMAVVSLISSKQFRKQIDKTQSLYIAIGSINGGLIGKFIFRFLIEQEIVTNQIVGQIQSAMLVGIMVIILILMNFRHLFTTYKLSHPTSIVAIGFLLGILSAFLGIGGGPLNVAILCWLFSMNTKQATINSVFIIFFSQLAAISVIVFGNNWSSYQLHMLPAMIIGGALGGLLGSRFAILINTNQIMKVFNVTIFCIMFINIYNFFHTSQ